MFHRRVMLSILKVVETEGRSYSILIFGLSKQRFRKYSSFLGGYSYHTILFGNEMYVGK